MAMDMQNKKMLFLVYAIASIIILVVVYTSLNTPHDSRINYTEDTFTFVSETIQFTVQYDKSAENAKLKLNDNQYDLKRARSASGAKYESADNKVVFGEHQGKAWVEINGETIVKDAVLKEERPEKEFSLENTSWRWENTRYSNEKIVEPIKVEDFVLSFMAERKFSATTDCNNLFGNYEKADTNIKFGQIASTKMACPNIKSLETEFAKMLNETESYNISDEGNLSLVLKLDTGTVTLSPTAPPETETDL